MAWFDASQIDPATGGSSLPLGIHPVVIIGSEPRAAKDNPQSGMLVFKLQFIDGTHRGFQGEYRLNIWNQNPKAAEIAHQQLSSLCHVVGVQHLHIDNPKGAELFNKPFKIVVEPQTDSKYTQIASVLTMSDAPPVKGQFSGAPQGQPTPPPGYPQQPTPGYSAPSAQQAPPAAPAAQPAPWGGNPGPQQPSQPAAAQQPAWTAQPPSGAPPWNR